MVLSQRRSGVLLHISSLPGPHGLGDLGPSAHRFVDWLAEAGQSLWQILPTNPVGPGHSPYQSVSAFGGSPSMVALEPLVAQGWLPQPALPDDGFPERRADYARCLPWREARLRAAFAGFESRAAHAAWCRAEAGWVDDYALFMALRDLQHGAPWWTWADDLRRRVPDALAAARRTHAAACRFWCFVQWCFDEQMAALRRHARQRGVHLVGDLPIFIAHDSADCWSRPDLYQLDAQFQPTHVAGVPPDGLSEQGQRWGNPLYRWDRMAAEGHAWWTARVRRALRTADVLRLDHFIGFQRYWAIPAGSPGAVAGEWRPGPGRALFDDMAAALGPLPLIAEDLGLVTPEVHALREACGLPGMKIVSFAFGGDGSHEFLPHNHPVHCVAYTGTHDNDTLRGWWTSASARERAFLRAYCGLDDTDDHDLHWALMRVTSQSPARSVIFPLQDVLDLPTEHRMNLPGSTDGNWAWRFGWEQIEPALTRRLARQAAASGRAPLALLDLP